LKLPQLQQQAQQSTNQMDIQQVADMQQFIDRLDKRIVVAFHFLIATFFAVQQ
jgi:uncharacterized protein YaaN involved in tellurite resistance